MRVCIRGTVEERAKSGFTGAIGYIAALGFRRGGRLCLWPPYLRCTGNGKTATIFRKISIQGRASYVRKARRGVPCGLRVRDRECTSERDVYCKRINTNNCRAHVHVRSEEESGAKREPIAWFHLSSVPPSRRETLHLLPCSFYPVVRAASGI